MELAECLIAHSSDMILKMYDRSLKGRYRLDAKVCFFPITHTSSVSCATHVDIPLFSLCTYPDLAQMDRKRHPMQCLAKENQHLTLSSSPLTTYPYPETETDPLEAPTMP